LRGASVYFFSIPESQFLFLAVTSGEPDIALDFALLQNYPNPFNPNTSIKYSIAQDGLVNLSVYNLLGEKVATLVNEVKQAGSYEIEFNDSNISSRVYFYQLNAGSFIETKKMTLMK